MGIRFKQTWRRIERWLFCRSKRDNLTYLHFAVVAIAYICRFAARYVGEAYELQLLGVGFLLAAISAVAGLVLMARRSGKSESILLAISTIAAFVLAVTTPAVQGH
jgi:hypothetical protein